MLTLAISITKHTGYRLAESLWAADKQQLVRYEGVQLQWSLVCRDAERRGSTPAAVSLAWLVRKPEVTSIIVGARNEAQLRDNLRALEVQLSAEDIADLDKASEPAWGYPYSFIGGREPW